jgi:hypothetical protein
MGRAAASVRRLSAADQVLLTLFLMVALGDSLLNLLPGSFSRFKEELQNQWVRRQPDPSQQMDRALFGTVNLLLGLAAATPVTANRQGGLPDRAARPRRKLSAPGPSRAPSSPSCMKGNP